MEYIPQYRVCRLVFALLFVQALPAMADVRCDHPVGRIAALHGNATITGAGKPASASLGAQLCTGDALDIAARSRAVLRLSDGTTLPLDASSSVLVHGRDADGRTLAVELRHGRMNVQAGDAKIHLITQFGSADTQGGGYSVTMAGQQAQLAVVSGAVTLQNGVGRHTVRGDESVFFDSSSPPRPNLLLKPADAVQWVARYPAVLDAAAIAKYPQLAHAAAAYSDGRLVDAEIELDRVAADQRQVEYHVLRANLDLLNGRVQQARAAADAALALQPSDAASCAVRAMAALAASQTDVAEQFARRAVAADAASAQAKLALSYVRQALGDIAQALDLARAASALEVDNALAHNRVAELELILGHVSAARLASDRARALAPRSPETLTMRGFVLLASDARGAAEQEFQAAIAAKSDDARARLGLGLARIYRGDIDAGAEELEIAASLDPENSLIQAYVGRAYAAQGKNELATAAFARAEKIDRNDPTSRSFRAQQLALANQPGQALDAALAAHGLAGRRSVYRGAALLAEDRALALANAVTQARVLGFDEWARALAMQAKQEAPGSWAALRADSDSLSSVPRSERNRRSEDFQAVLSEPLHAPFHRLEPSGESQQSPGAVAGQHGLLQSIEPGATGFNDFAAVFGKNPVQARTELLLGSAGTAGELAQARLAGSSVSLEAGYAHLRSRGFFADQQLNNRVFEGRLRFMLPTGTLVTLDARHYESVRHELLIPEDPLNYGSQPQDVDERRDVSRIGLVQKFGDHLEAMIVVSNDRDRQAVSPCLTPQLLSYLRATGSATQGCKEDLGGLLFPFPYSVNVKAHDREFRLAWSGEHLRIVAGGGRVVSRYDQVINIGGTDFGSILANQYNYYRYVYGSWQAMDRLWIDLGKSYEVVRRLPDDAPRHFPKLGASWQAAARSWIRWSRVGGAYRPFAGGATLEPVAVAGFSQFHPAEDFGTSVRDALRLDHAVSDDLSTGAELSRRKIRMEQSTRWQENDARLWGYWKVGRRLLRAPGWEMGLGLSADRQHFVRDDAGGTVYVGEQAITVLTQSRVQLSMRARHAGGLGLDLSAYRVSNHGTQSITVPDPANNWFRSEYQSMSDTAWMADASLSWRLLHGRGQIEVGVKNLFDRRGFKYIEMDPVSPRVSPERLVFSRIQLSY